MLNRSTAQAISAMLGNDLVVIKHVRQSMKELNKVIKGMGLKTPITAYKHQQKIKAEESRKALLQWKLKRYMAGETQYITGDELNAVKSFMKNEINIYEELYAVSKDCRDYKDMKLIRQKILKLADIQRKVRQSAVEYGKSIRKDSEFYVGQKVEITKSPTQEETKLNFVVNDEWPLGCTDEMIGMAGAKGVVVGIMKTGFGFMGYQVQTAKGTNSWWWTAEQLKKI